MDWFTDKEAPVNLVFMYFEEPDEIAHGFGSESSQVSIICTKLLCFFIYVDRLWFMYSTYDL